MTLSAEKYSIYALETKRKQANVGKWNWLFGTINYDLYDNFFCLDAQLLFVKTIIYLEHYLESMKEVTESYHNVQTITSGNCSAKIQFITMGAGMVLIFDINAFTWNKAKHVDYLTIRGEIGIPKTEVYYYEHTPDSPTMLVYQRQGKEGIKDLQRHTNVRYSNSILLSKIANLVSRINLQYDLEGSIYMKELALHTDAQYDLKGTVNMPEIEYYSSEIAKKEQEYEELNKYALKEISFTDEQVTLSESNPTENVLSESKQLFLIKEKNKYEFENAVSTANMNRDISETKEFQLFVQASEKLFQSMNTDETTLFKVSPYFKQYLPGIHKSFKTLKSLKDEDKESYQQLVNKTLETLSAVANWLEEQIKEISLSKKELVSQELDEIMQSIKHTARISI